MITENASVKHNGSLISVVTWVINKISYIKSTIRLGPEDYI